VLEKRFIGKIMEKKAYNSYPVCIVIAASYWWQGKKKYVDCILYNVGM